MAWKRVKAFGEDAGASRKALTLARDFVDNTCQVVGSRELVDQALQLAIDEGIAAYDSLYLELARRLKVKLLTTDETLHRKVEGSSRISGLTIVP